MPDGNNKTKTRKTATTTANLFKLDGLPEGDDFDPFGQAWKTKPGTPAPWFDKRGRRLLFGEWKKRRPGRYSAKRESIWEYVYRNEKKIFGALKKSDALHYRQRIAMKIAKAIGISSAKPDDDVMDVLRQLTKRVVSRKKMRVQKITLT